MLKLKDLLRESAAEEAKKKGYTAKPYGKWEKDGKIVARTVDDKLVPVNQDDSTPAAQDRNMKPTGMSAAQAGKTINKAASPPPNPDMLGKNKTDSEKTIEKRDKAQEKQTAEQPQAQPLPTLQKLEIGSPINTSDVRKLTGQIKDHTGIASEDNVIGESTYLLRPHELTSFIKQPSSEVYKANAEWHRAKKQSNEEFWQKLNPLQFEELVTVKKLWQDMEQYFHPNEKRIVRNTLINGLAHEYKPEIITSVPLERGMIFDENNFRQFIQEFRIGHDTTLPPSGFSVGGAFARDWANTHTPNKIGVVMRMHPTREGTTPGFALSGVTDRPDVDDTMINYYLHHESNDLDHEQEILRPGNTKARCVNVTKLLTRDRIGQDEEYFRVTYVIDMEDLGYDEPKIQEQVNKKQRNPVFDQIMNTCFGFWKPKDNRSDTQLTTILGR